MLLYISLRTFYGSLLKLRQICTRYIFRNILLPLHITKLRHIHFVFYSQFDLELHYKAQCFSTPQKLCLPRRSQPLRKSLSHSRVFYDSGDYFYVKTATQDIFTCYLSPTHTLRLTFQILHCTMPPVRKMDVRIAQLLQAQDVNM